LLLAAGVGLLSRASSFLSLPQTPIMLMKEFHTWWLWLYWSRCYRIDLHMG